MHKLFTHHILHYLVDVCLTDELKLINICLKPKAQVLIPIKDKEVCNANQEYVAKYVRAVLFY